jgi:hypothetical protein
MSIEFVSVFSGASWILVNIYIYDIFSPEGKQQFLQRFHNIDMPEDTVWLLVWDFNLIQQPYDRNKSGRKCAGHVSV